MKLSQLPLQPGQNGTPNIFSVFGFYEGFH